ncbi:MAG: c-type cytochrome [Polyangiaceae bacterium]|nr:c-type cytochrome [Polyangiaceae bacterium]
MTKQARAPESTIQESSGGRLAATDGRVLPLKETRLTVDAKGGIARTTLQQTFANPHAEPLAVTYLLPLPADGAVSGFAFRIGERRICGEIDCKQAARERYEQALSEGRSVALLEQDRSSLFTQEIGNIPPHTEVVAEIAIDQRLAWLSEGAWELRFPTTVAPRYQGAPGRVADAKELNVPISGTRLAARMHVDVIVRDALAGGGRAESSSHAMRFRAEAGAMRGSLDAGNGAPLDRDLVVRWSVAQPEVGISLVTSWPKASEKNSHFAFGLLTIVPPRPQSQTHIVSRDLIVLIDTSGSMRGEPLEQAKRIVGVLIDSLDARDHLELIAFSSSAHRFNAEPALATQERKHEAQAWLQELRASGGTEMTDALLDALTPLCSEAQRQVILVTDGFIGFESEVVASILTKLPQRSRLHTVGVGSAVNRSLTAPAARAGRGLEVVVGLGEDSERAARRLLARTERPLVTDMVAEGTALIEYAPRRLPDLFSGAPVLVGIKLRPEGGTLEVKGWCVDGIFSHRIDVPPIERGTADGAVVALFAREQIEDLEMSLAGGVLSEEINPQIERLGVEFQISTRLTSWIAISTEKDVDTQSSVRREIMPHEAPFGTSVESFGLRQEEVPAYRAVIPYKVIHSVDGIEHYDNKLPKRWLFTLYGAIAFSAVYLFSYHLFSFFNHPFGADTADQNVAVAKHDSGGGDGPVTVESLIAASKDPATVDQGKQIFQQNCVACHAANGGGGFGPNLTDDYWLHGGAPDKIYNSIFHGVVHGAVKKGMQAWGPVLGPDQIKAVTAYVYTLHGTNVPGGKAPQGERDPEQ